eukprot:gene27603-34348_t
MDSLVGEYFDLASMGFWATSLMLNDAGCKVVDPISLTLINFTTACVLSIIFAVYFESSTVFLTPATLYSALTANIFMVIVVAFSETTAILVSAMGQKYVLPTRASLLLSLESVSSAFFGYFFLSETLNGVELLGCALMLMSAVASSLYGTKKEDNEYEHTDTHDNLEHFKGEVNHGDKQTNNNTTVNTCGLEHKDSNSSSVTVNNQSSAAHKNIQAIIITNRLLDAGGQELQEFFDKMVERNDDDDEIYCSNSNFSHMDAPRGTSSSKSVQFTRSSHSANMNTKQTVKPTTTTRSVLRGFVRLTSARSSEGSGGSGDQRTNFRVPPTEHTTLLTRSTSEGGMADSNTPMHTIYSVFSQPQPNYTTNSSSSGKQKSAAIVINKSNMNSSDTHHSYKLPAIKRVSTRDEEDEEEDYESGCETYRTSSIKINKDTGVELSRLEMGCVSRSY